MRKVCKLPDCYPVSNDNEENITENFVGRMPEGVTSSLNCDNQKAWLQRWDNNMPDLCYYNTGGTAKVDGKCGLTEIDIGTYAAKSSDAGGAAGDASRPCWGNGVPKSSTAATPCPVDYLEIPTVNSVTGGTHPPQMAGMCIDARPVITNTAVCDKSKGWINRLSASLEDTCYYADGGHPYATGTTCPTVTKDWGALAPCNKTPCFIQGLPKPASGSCPTGYKLATGWTPLDKFANMCVKDGDTSQLKPGGACNPGTTRPGAGAGADADAGAGVGDPGSDSTTAPSTTGQWINGVDNTIVMGGAAAVVLLIVMMK